MKNPAFRRDSNTPAPIRSGRSAAATSGGEELLEAAQEIEREQQAALEAAPIEQTYQEALAIYVQSKFAQVEHIEDRLENLIDRQQARLQQAQAGKPGSWHDQVHGRRGRPTRRSSRRVYRFCIRALRSSAKSRKAWASTRPRSKSWPRARCAPSVPT